MNDYGKLNTKIGSKSELLFVTAIILFRIDNGLLFQHLSSWIAFGSNWKAWQLCVSESVCIAGTLYFYGSWAETGQICHRYLLLLYMNDKSLFTSFICRNMNDSSKLSWTVPSIIEVSNYVCYNATLYILIFGIQQIWTQIILATSSNPRSITLKYQRETVPKGNFEP